MKTRYLLIFALVAALIGGGAYVTYRALDVEPEWASGPLVAALMEARTPGERRTDLNHVFDRFVDNALPIEDRVPLLESEGFTCRINPSDSVSDNRILSCVRPLEGTWFCEGFSYFVYVTGAGEIYDRNGTDWSTIESRRENGRCPSNDPRTP